MSAHARSGPDFAPLTAKQARFVDEYLIDLNATQAAVRAGYSPKTATAIGAENLTKPNIQSAIENRQKDRSQRTEITQDKVLADLEAVKRDAMQKLPDRDGRLVMVNHAAALRAAELQGRHLGMFPTRQEITGKDGKDLMSRRPEEMTDEELLAIASGGISRPVDGQ